jgi:hypothetical protein
MSENHIIITYTPTDWLLIFLDVVGKLLQNDDGLFTTNNHKTTQQPTKLCGKTGATTNKTEESKKTGFRKPFN